MYVEYIQTSCDTTMIVEKRNDFGVSGLHAAVSVTHF